MPSFDAVSELDLHEVTNATDQAKRELGNRWDFKNVTADVSLEKDRVVLSAEHDFQVEQLVDILRSSFTKRACISFKATLRFKLKSLTRLTSPMPPAPSKPSS